MLKKTLKKILAVALTVAAVATTLAVPVSAATLKPKKSHSKAEITEYVNYFNDITYAYTFRPDRYVPALISTSVLEDPNDSYNYESYKMTVLLQNTKGITAEQKADMKKAASLWKKSYISEQMLNYYWHTWLDFSSYIEDYSDSGSSKDSASNYKSKAKQAYNKVNSYIAKKAKYNSKLAGELKKYNKIRLNAWNKDIDKWFKMSKKQKAKYWDYLPRYVHSYASALSKADMSANPYYSPSAEGLVDEYGDKNHYVTKTLGIWGYDLSEDSPSRDLFNHTRWTKW